MRFLVFALTFAALAGCFGSAQEPEAALLIDGATVTCHVEPCPTWSIGSDGIQVSLGDFDVNYEAKFGVVIKDAAAPVTVSGAIRNVEHGVFLRGTLCDACKIHLQDLAVSAKSTGIFAAVRNGLVEMSNVTVETAGGGTVTMEPIPLEGASGQIPFKLNGTDGIWIAANNAHFDLHGVTANAREPSAFNGLNLQAYNGATFKFTDIAVANHDIGIFLKGQEVVKMTGIDIDCQRLGIYFFVDPRDVELHDVRVHGCQGTGITAGNAHRFHAEGLHLHDNHVGLILSQDEHVTMAAFNFSYNDYGLVTEGSQTSRLYAKFSDGLVMGNRFLGVRSQWDTAEFTNVRFVSNGHEWEDAPTDDGERWYGALVHRGPQLFDSTATVRDSTFEDNRPFAIANNQDTTAVDARENWWGTPVGPTWRFYGTPTDSPGQEAVYGPVITTPHLTSSPQDSMPPFQVASSGV